MATPSSIKYEWLRDKQSQDVQDYVAAQNRYCEQRMAPLAIVAQNVVRGIQVACAGNRHVRADAHGRLLVLHPHPCRGGNTPRNAACRSAARTIGIRRPVEAGVPTRRRTGGVRYERRGARPRFLPHRRHGHFQGRPLDAVRHRHELATNATISASVILETGDELEEAVRRHRRSLLHAGRAMGVLCAVGRRVASIRGDAPPRRHPRDR